MKKILALLIVLWLFVLCQSTKGQLVSLCSELIQPFGKDCDVLVERECQRAVSSVYLIEPSIICILDSVFNSELITKRGIKRIVLSVTYHPQDSEGFRFGVSISEDSQYERTVEDYLNSGLFSSHKVTTLKGISNSLFFGLIYSDKEWSPIHDTYPSIFEFHDTVSFPKYIPLKPILCK